MTLSINEAVRVLECQKNGINPWGVDGKEYSQRKQEFTCQLYALLCKIRPEILAVADEVTRAMIIHAPMNSAHEGYAVIREELEELWDEIKFKESERDVEHLREEATQIAAMGIRFIIDVCNKESSHG